MIKSPKLYFLDTGLLSYLLRYPDADTLRAGPMAGAFFENFIVTEALKLRCHTRGPFELYFYRDSNQQEIDVVVESAQKFLLLEIKLSKTPSPDDAAVMKRQFALFPRARGAVLSFAEETIRGAESIEIGPWTRLYELLNSFAEAK
ncbi:MAG: DUF4143 domain-containing protein [Kiritimatiellae bacterium]|nr:DUF4143 domain-containing protein [Kiritimatiellia bacterium]MCO5069501.1 DUF4143 domain-containing protein [Kiritimatiellia bacterium]